MEDLLFKLNELEEQMVALDRRQRFTLARIRQETTYSMVLAGIAATGGVFYLVKEAGWPSWVAVLIVTVAMPIAAGLTARKSFDREAPIDG